MLLWCGLLLPGASAANWAQVFGDNDQNVVLTARMPWSARYGHALVAMTGQYGYIESAEDNGFTYRSSDRLFMLGGDDFDEVSSWSSRQ